MATLSRLDPFTALANPVRREILANLRRRPRRAGELAAGMARAHGIGRPAVSEHLQVLRRARLVREERQGRERWYYLDARPMRDVEKWVAAFSSYWKTRFNELELLLDERKDDG